MLNLIRTCPSIRPPDLSRSCCWPSGRPPELLGLLYCWPPGRPPGQPLERFQWTLGLVMLRALRPGPPHPLCLGLLGASPSGEGTVTVLGLFDPAFSVSCVLSIFLYYDLFSDSLVVLF
uniref:Uncharacterized protein n=1 Tax=Haplochromis burtoni TaxID=8153 RepID=A0A3Q2WP57_HAPBU